MNKHGLYSKAAQIIRSLPQEKGTAEQMIGAAKKLGIKQVEIDNAKPPTGPITREALAKHFEDAIPNLGVSQYGENPRYTTNEENKRFRDIPADAEMSPQERLEYNRHVQRSTSRPEAETSQYEGDEDYFDTADTQYGDYTIPGGKDYRERLLRLERPTGKPAEHYEVHTSHPDYARFGQYETLDEAQLAADEFYDRHGGDYNTTTVKRRNPDTGSYRSSHWSDHPNVLAHIRMSDRMVGEDRETVRPIAQKLADHFKVGVRDLGSYAADQGVKDGVVSPEEAASFARIMNFPFSKYHSAPGIGKRLLHVEELQSDWGQDGRDKGFHDPENPYEVVNRYTKEVVSQHPDYQSMWDAYRTAPNSNDLDIITAKNEKPPAAPYVQNTQHWTDLALKNVLREAALGNYDGVVFSPGQAQADRYGLEKQVDKVLYDPANSVLTAVKDGAHVMKRSDVSPEDLPALIGNDVSKKLLHPDNTFNAGDAENQYHMVQGEDLKMGGEGMKGYYDNIVPKSVMALAKQHDPSAKPGEPITLQSNDGDYQGFHLPMTETMKNSILDKGFSAFKRGGAVDAALALTRRFTKR
jgi:hypothetical protein